MKIYRKGVHLFLVHCFITFKIAVLNIPNRKSIAANLEAALFRYQKLGSAILEQNLLDLSTQQDSAHNENELSLYNADPFNS